MSNYLIELSVIHTALIVGYWMFLRKERQFSRMRFYLLASTLLALIIPLLKFPKLFFNNSETAEAITIGTISMDAMTVAPATSVSVWSLYLLIWIYIAISTLFLAKFLSGVWFLISLERKSTREKLGDIYIRKVADIKGSFTFFNWIFLSKDIDPHRHNYQVILKHEKAHASLGHTYDVIFFELFKVCFWWLPTAWLNMKEIKKIHEYQADAAALKSCDVDQYSSILIRSTLNTHGLGLPAGKRPSSRQASLASSFYDGLILKRLAAMKLQVKKISLWKLGALSALCASLIIAFACSEEMDREIKEISKKSNAITFDQLPASMQTDLAGIKDGLTFLRIDVSEDNKLSEKNRMDLDDLDPTLIHTISVDKINHALYVAVKKDAANFNYLAEKSKMDGDIFTVVEAQPEFEGGIGAFRSYIMNEIRYPLQARQAGVEGVVDVQFVVEKDGSLSEVTAIKGIGGGCDEEAVRVLQNSPRFKPATQNGKAVRVRMVVPITFKLNEGKTNPDNSTQGMVIIEEVQPRNETLAIDADYADGEWTGTVYDQEGNRLPGATIVVFGTTTGTISNLEGQFKVKADESQDLVISFVGYETVRLEGK